MTGYNVPQWKQLASAELGPDGGAGQRAEALDGLARRGGCCGCGVVVLLAVGGGAIVGRERRAFAIEARSAIDGIQ